MADASQRTEKPTPRRLERARKEGRFPSSKEALASAMFAVAGWLILAYFTEWMGGLRQASRFLFTQAYAETLSLRDALRLLQFVLLGQLAPLLVGGAAVFAAGLGAQAAITGMGFAGSKLAPDFTRLNPLSRLKGLLPQNGLAAAQAIALLAVFGALLWTHFEAWLPAILRMPAQPVPAALGLSAQFMEELLRQAILIFALWGALDFARARWRYAKELRMSKQEIREEMKESEGSPEIKQKIRKLQRDAARRRMMQQVPKATAVVVNPTHYAVALRFDSASMAAPTVVAKGRNYLARRIREIALANEVPIIENPPLARSLYATVEVGQEIPAALYRAVAEVLAYLFRLRQTATAGRAGR